MRHLWQETRFLTGNTSFANQTARWKQRPAWAGNMGTPPRVHAAPKLRGERSGKGLQVRRPGNHDHSAGEHVAGADHLRGDRETGGAHAGVALHSDCRGEGTSLQLQNAAPGDGAVRSGDLPLPLLWYQGEIETSDETGFLKAPQQDVRIRALENCEGIRASESSGDSPSGGRRFRDSV